MFEQILIRFRGGPIANSKDEDEESDDNSSDTATSPAASDGVVAMERLQLPLSRSVGCPLSPSPSLRSPSPSTTHTNNSTSPSGSNSPSPSLSPSPSPSLSLSTSPINPSSTHRSHRPNHPHLQTPPLSTTSSANMARKSSKKTESPSREPKTRGQKRKAAEMGPAPVIVVDHAGDEAPRASRNTRAAARRKLKEEKEQQEQQVVETRERKRKREKEEKAVAVGNADDDGVGGAPEVPAKKPTRRPAKGKQKQEASAEPEKPAGKPSTRKGLHPLLRAKRVAKVGFSWWRNDAWMEQEEKEEAESRGRRKRRRLEANTELLILSEDEDEDAVISTSNKRQRGPAREFPRYQYSEEVLQRALPGADPLGDGRYAIAHAAGRNGIAGDPEKLGEAAAHANDFSQEKDSQMKYKALSDALEPVVDDNEKFFEILGVTIPKEPGEMAKLLRKKRRLLEELREYLGQLTAYVEERERIEERKLDVTYAGWLRSNNRGALQLRSRLIERQYWDDGEAKGDE